MAWRALFWRQWVAANALAELLGLGAVAALGYALAARRARLAFGQTFSRS
jgi:hypothetical protein